MKREFLTDERFTLMAAEDDEYRRGIIGYDVGAPQFDVADPMNRPPRADQPRPSPPRIWSR
jgi:hypothetical protein